MAAVSTTYYGTFGEILYAGLTAPVESPYPAWREAIAANTWAQIPTTNKLSEINPKLNPSLNPNYPASPEWEHSPATFAGMITGWNGACYDAVADVWWFPLQGGHADYAGNEPYKLALNTDTPTFVMVRPPSGAIGNLLTTDDGQEVTGLYSDGRPRPGHSYNKPVYIPGVGPAIGVLAGTSWSALGIAKPVIISPTTGEMTTFGALHPSMYASKGASCYDPTRHCIWFRHSGTGYMAKYDIAGNSWTTHGSNFSFDGDGSLCYLPEDDCLLWTSTFFANDFAVFDCATSTIYQPSATGSLVGITDTGKSQAQWVPSLGAAALWDNTTNTTLINILTKPANPRTGTWVKSQLTVSGSNTVTPTAKAANGTFGRFNYSPLLNGFMLLNAVDQKPYFFALD